MTKTCPLCGQNVHTLYRVQVDTDAGRRLVRDTAAVYFSADPACYAGTPHPRYGRATRHQVTSFLFATDVDLCMTCALPAVDPSEATAQGEFAVGSRVRRAGNDECGNIRQIQGSTAVVAADQK